MTWGSSCERCGEEDRYKGVIFHRRLPCACERRTNEREQWRRSSRDGWPLSAILALAALVTVGVITITKPSAITPQPQYQERSR